MIPSILLSIARTSWPYVVVASISASVVWWVQSLNVRSCRLEFSEYRTEQSRLISEANEKQRIRQEETSKTYQSQLSKLEKDHEIYKRCVAAGKCGAVWVPNLSSCGSGIKVQATDGTDATSANAVPPATGVAEEALRDCATTTFMLNRLQDDIASQ